jgi:ATP-dependent Clp protease protease subunit
LLEEKKSATAKRPATGNVNVDQEMLKRRVLFLNGEITDDSAKVLVQQLLWLEAEDPQAPVTIYINSGGGFVHSGLALVDVMMSASMPLKTVCAGRCHSMAALVLASGTHSHRSAFGNARMMIHEPSNSYSKMQATDMAIKVAELQNHSHTLARLFAERTGRSEAEILDFFSRDRYMSAKEAKEFGLIDDIRPAAGRGILEERTEVPASSSSEENGSKEPVPVVQAASPEATPSTSPPVQPAQGELRNPVEIHSKALDWVELWPPPRERGGSQWLWQPMAPPETEK